MRLKLADANLKKGDLRGAIGEYIRAADLLPDSMRSAGQGRQHAAAGRAFEDAKTRAEKALEIDPKNVEAMILLGNALAGLKDLDGAVAEYQEALALNPAADAASANIGAIQFIRGQKETAEATFTKAVESAPKSVNARMALANFYWATGRPKEAEDGFKAALALDPQNLAAHRAIGVFYMATGRGAEAEPYFKTIADGGQDDRRHDRSRRLLHRHQANRRSQDGPQGTGQKTDAFAASHHPAGGR